MLKLHDELIAELSNLLTTQNYNSVVVANHRLYARAFLDYLAECDVQVETVTLAQVDQYLAYAVQDFEARYGRPPCARWQMLPRTSINKLLRLAQGKWPPEPEIIEPEAVYRQAICCESKYAIPASVFAPKTRNASSKNSFSSETPGAPARKGWDSAFPSYNACVACSATGSP